MKKLYETWPFNFGAIHKQDFKKSKIVVAPVPYDATSSFKGGMREGPYAIIGNSRYVDELLENESGEKLTGLKATDIFTLDEVVLSRNSAKEAIEGIEQAISEEIVKRGKIPLMLGGEHSITLGAVRALRKKYKDLSVLQFDAHTDLMDEYEGSQYSHASVMRRILNLKIPAVQIGIRNMNTEIEKYLAKNPKQEKNIYFAPGLPGADEVAGKLTKNVYLTFDLDAFDPSIMPSVGTPEPGGLLWNETVEFIENISKKVNIVGADVVELMPIPGLHAPDFMAAKLVYEIIKAILAR
ncbi:MAG: agmatinase [Candidatus Moranbacteria bacterium]|nr:agmatinase [Candidatus Moranbacteria bacterium]